MRPNGQDENIRRAGRRRLTASGARRAPSPRRRHGRDGGCGGATWVFGQSLEQPNVPGGALILSAGALTGMAVTSRCCRHQREPTMRRPFGQHYAFVVAGVTFAALLVAAGLRAAPSVLMLPLGVNFGWSRATVSTAAAIGICLYGLVGPFAAA